LNFGKSIFFIFLLFILSGCVGGFAPSYVPQHRRIYKQPYFYNGYEQKGIASWYGADFDGKPTASGEIYDMYAHTAAHKTLPLGTIVKVTNLNNGKSTVVKINDRGPFVKGRIIDLSYSAARDIGIDKTGTAPVILRVVGGNYKTSELFTLQVGAFRFKSNANRLKKRLSASFSSVSVKRIYQSGMLLYKVFVGSFDTPVQSSATKKILADMGFFSFLTVK